MLVLLLKISLLVDLGVLAPIGLILGQSPRALPVINGLSALCSCGRPQVTLKGCGPIWGIQAFVQRFGWPRSWPLVTPSGRQRVRLLGRSEQWLWLEWHGSVQRRAGGLTGDFMGAIQQLAELGILFSLASAL